MPTVTGLRFVVGSALLVVLLSSLVVSWISFLHVAHTATDNASGFAAVMWIAAVPYIVSFFMGVRKVALKSVLRRNKFPSLNYAESLRYFLWIVWRSGVETIGLIVLLSIQFVSKGSNAVNATSFGCAVTAIPLAMSLVKNWRKRRSANKHGVIDDEVSPLLEDVGSQDGHSSCGDFPRDNGSPACVVLEDATDVQKGDHCTAGTAQGYGESQRGNPPQEYWECGCVDSENRNGTMVAPEDTSFIVIRGRVIEKWILDNIACLCLIGGILVFAAFSENASVQVCGLTFLGVICVSWYWPVAGQEPSRVYDPYGFRYEVTAWQSAISLAILAAAVKLIPSYTALPFDEHDILLSSPFKDHGLMLGLNIVCSYVAYQSALTSCRLRMQRAVFVPSVVLAPIISALVAWYSCELGIPYLQLNCEADGQGIPVWEWAMFFLFYLSLLFATRGIFAEETKHLAMESDIFLRVGYSGILSLQWLAFNRRETTQQLNKGTSSQRKKKVFVCATLYRENAKEMKQLLSSVFDLVKNLGMNVDFRVMILFDKPFVTESVRKPSGEWVEQVATVEVDGEEIPMLNKYGHQLKHLLEDAMESDGKISKLTLSAHEDIGHRWRGMIGPNNTVLDVYLKDHTKIRAGKRWSMNLYMSLIFENELGQRSAESCGGTTGSLRDVFVLTLDGDVHFKPVAVRNLIDKMDVHPHVGGVCGRIHPIGDNDALNPTVGFQKFEYACGHWLQKAAENVCGSVLCLPGCFSLFRGCCMNSVREGFCHEVQTGVESLKFDMGEDRMLCTLLIQKGATLEYAPSAHALTFCPEEFKELFNQRRRWICSTIANLVHLIANATDISAKSDRIGLPFIVLQAIMLYAALISPSVVLMIFLTFLGYHWAVEALIILLPIVYVALLVTPRLRKETKMGITASYSLVCAILMGSIMVMVVDEIASDPTTPASLFFLGLVFMLTFTSVVNGESHLLPYGLIYFFFVPAAYLVLPLYSYANVVDTSWGTREGATKEQTQPTSTLGLPAGDADGNDADALSSAIARANEAAENATAAAAAAGEAADGAAEAGDAGGLPGGLRARLAAHETAKLAAAAASAAMSHAADSRKAAAASSIDKAVSEANQANRAAMEARTWATCACNLDDCDDLQTWTTPHRLKARSDFRSASITKSKNQDLVNVRTQLLGIAFVLNMLWVGIQVTVESKDGIVSYKNSDVFSFFFISVFTTVMLVQFGSAIIFTWNRLMEVTVYSGVHKRRLRPRTERASLSEVPL